MTLRFLILAMLTPCCTTALAAVPWIVAHRGASHDAPENTLAAFRLAWEQGADAIEGDFRLSRDGQVVCLHDATTQRTAGTNLVAAHATLAELRQLDVGRWKGPQWTDERIPTLAEVLALVPPPKRIFIEIKCGPEIIPALKPILARSPVDPARMAIIAFDASVIAAAKTEFPTISAYWLTSYKQDPRDQTWRPDLPAVLATLKQSHADGLDSHAHELVDEAFVAGLRAANYPLHVWTVDDPAVATRFLRLGVHSITTNRPQWLRQQLQ